MKKEHEASLDQVKYFDIFGDKNKKYNIIQVFQKWINRRKQVQASSLALAYSGKNTAPKDFFFLLFHWKYMMIEFEFESFF